MERIIDDRGASYYRELWSRWTIWLRSSLANRQRRGFFSKNSLKINFVVVGQSQPIYQQLIGGALTFGNCFETDTIGEGIFVCGGFSDISIESGGVLS